MSAPAVQIVVMGVASTGKSAVGQRLADRLGLAYVEGDDQHSPENVAKMSAGVPGAGAAPPPPPDREPWLEALAGILARSREEGRTSVVTCSALRRRYRDLLRGDEALSAVFFVHLDAPEAVLRDRMSRRARHFMPTSLLRSQLDTLEPLEPDEYGVRVDVSGPLDAVVDRVVAEVAPLTGHA
jgi:gluconokinase